MQRWPLVHWTPLLMYTLQLQSERDQQVKSSQFNAFHCSYGEPAGASLLAALVASNFGTVSSKEPFVVCRCITRPSDLL